jgi:CheY-like chemotaxis protein
MASPELVERHGAELVLLEVSTPDVDGCQLLTAMRDYPKHADLPIIVLSGSDDPGLKSRSLDLGADDFITKPFHDEELAARIRAVLRRSRKFRALDGAMSGVLSEVPLPVVIQTLAMNNRSATIRLPDEAAEIHHRDGRLTGTSFRTFVGLDALTRLCLGATGRFEIEFDSASSETPPVGPRTEHLLLEIAQQVDELATMVRPVPSLDTPLRLDFAQEAPDVIIETFAQWQPVSARRVLTVMPGHLRENALMLGLLFGLGTLVPSERRP